MHRTCLSGADPPQGCRDLPVGMKGIRLQHLGSQRWQWGTQPGRAVEGSGGRENHLRITQDRVALQGKDATLWPASKQMLNFNLSKMKNPHS